MAELMLSQQMNSDLRKEIINAYRMDETKLVKLLAKEWAPELIKKERIRKSATALVLGIRERRLAKRGLDSFIHEYDLSTEEGVILMCLAEALLRTPDKENIDRLIRDKLTKAGWEQRVGKSSSLFVNAATWGLMLTGKILAPPKSTHSMWAGLKKLLEKTSEPVIRSAISQGMRILGRQFVMGQTIEEALQRAVKYEQRGYRFSYDMLGEAAKTAADAERYFFAYQQAISHIQKFATHPQFEKNPGISVKLSALYPRYEYSKREYAEAAITDKLLQLAEQCAAANIPLTVDAEEADRLDMSLNIIENVFLHPSLQTWNGFGLALQAYQKRAWYVLDWLIDLAKRGNKRLMVRLIKGAYWDSEIKFAQERGLEGYPVFTRKVNTDISFLACAKKMLANNDVIFPMFASHNAHTVASIIEMAGDYRDFEFQGLHGMSATLYDQLVSPEKEGYTCRVYAPVGSHEELLPYLVRRLLENGANSSFVNRISDVNLPIDEIIVDPVDKLARYKSIPHPKIPLPRNLYSDRLNSSGLDISNPIQMVAFENVLRQLEFKTWQAAPTFSKDEQAEKSQQVFNPANLSEQVGTVREASLADIMLALEKAEAYFPTWDALGVESRADLLEKSANILEQNRDELLVLLIRETGKTLVDAIAEVREAVDFCRYYAAQARKHLTVLPLRGYTGESNELYYHGRGPMVCISPWNFPLAIFTGQMMAALVAGNPVLAKPAEQAPLIAARAVELFHQAGIAKEALQLLPGSGEKVGAELVRGLRTQGVFFTGSTEVAYWIQKTLAERKGPIVPFIAETGGMNAMIVDSSALTEQVVQDVLTSAFYSTGQRCSALRILFLQEEIADKVINMLQGAVQELRIGNPSDLTIDIGPVIDSEALEKLNVHVALMEQKAKKLFQASLAQSTNKGYYFAPIGFEIAQLKTLDKEVFGPILHICRFKLRDLDEIIQSINETGYGLTLGIHSRIEETIQRIINNAKVGNIYVNRNMIGAVVGVQPFGGQGLSGTGPKAGGPHYLLRCVTERTVCVNTTAAGGNASLMSLEEDI